MSLPQWAIEEKEQIKEAKVVVKKIKTEASKLGISDCFEIDLAGYIVHLLHGMELRQGLKVLSYVGGSIFHDLTEDGKIGSLAETFENAYKKSHDSKKE